MPLNDTERLVVDCHIMRLKEGEALDYMKAKGHEIDRRTYYRIRGRLEGQYMKQLYEIARRFPFMHLERINEVELIRSELWLNYRVEKSPYKRAMILRIILELQPYASAYAEATRDILEGELAKQNREANFCLSE